jgi:hypothetical protein
MAALDICPMNIHFEMVLVPVEKLDLCGRPQTWIQCSAAGWGLIWEPVAEHYFLSA